ncbi:Rv3654c family TadE-like protein [Amycolatopsis sp.]|uniref:Rv3654c family TadE-like protein n=1 Tax=Amycolatopsis sp. TaxID=37632 RepID=UPI002D7FB9F0|nr:Rv3654c family TadE-like protein [Amycolatopsis sp.]HET6703402.1 Rv3654c family TadE-like protein [Amycolatopsis sp.]
MPRAEAQVPDRGAATIWTALAVAALTGVATLAIWLGATVIARHKAEAAADLGALAAASHASEGPARACERARWVTDRMGVTLRSCRWQQLDALVEVEARTPAIAGLPQASAHARAGPAAEPSHPPTAAPTGEPARQAPAPTGDLGGTPIRPLRPDG